MLALWLVPPPWAGVRRAEDSGGGGGRKLPVRPAAGPPSGGGGGRGLLLALPAWRRAVAAALWKHVAAQWWEAGVETLRQGLSAPVTCAACRSDINSAVSLPRSRLRSRREGPQPTLYMKVCGTRARKMQEQKGRECCTRAVAAPADCKHFCGDLEGEEEGGRERCGLTDPRMGRPRTA